jgi:hypothetical protein
LQAGLVVRQLVLLVAQLPEVQRLPVLLLQQVVQTVTLRRQALPVPIALLSQHLQVKDCLSIRNKAALQRQLQEPATRVPIRHCQIFRWARSGHLRYGNRCVVSCWFSVLIAKRDRTEICHSQGAEMKLRQ